MMKLLPLLFFCTVLLSARCCASPAEHKTRKIILETFAFQMNRTEAVEFLFKVNPAGQPDYALQEIEKLVVTGKVRKIAQVTTQSPDSRRVGNSAGTLTVGSETLLASDGKWAHIGAVISLGKATLNALQAVTTVPGIAYFGAVPIGTDKSQVILVFALCHTKSI